MAAPFEYGRWAARRWVNHEEPDTYALPGRYGMDYIGHSLTVRNRNSRFGHTLGYCAKGSGLAVPEIGLFAVAPLWLLMYTLCPA
jgi:hypothetical protein